MPVLIKRSQVAVKQSSGGQLERVVCTVGEVKSMSGDTHIERSLLWIEFHVSGPCKETEETLSGALLVRHPNVLSRQEQRRVSPPTHTRLIAADPGRTLWTPCSHG